MRDLLIRGADLIGRGRSDLLISNGRFVEPADAGGDVDQLDADGLVALPGLPVTDWPMCGDLRGR